MWFFCFLRRCKVFASPFPKGRVGEFFGKVYRLLATFSHRGVGPYGPEAEPEEIRDPENVAFETMVIP